MSSAHQALETCSRVKYYHSRVQYSQPKKLRTSELYLMYVYIITIYICMYAFTYEYMYVCMIWPIICNLHYIIVKETIHNYLSLHYLVTYMHTLSSLLCFAKFLIILRCMQTAECYNRYTKLPSLPNDCFIKHLKYNIATDIHF